MSPVSGTIPLIAENIVFWVKSIVALDISVTKKADGMANTMVCALESAVSILSVRVR